MTVCSQFSVFNLQALGGTVPPDVPNVVLTKKTAKKPQDYQDRADAVFAVKSALSALIGVRISASSLKGKAIANWQ